MTLPGLYEDEIARRLPVWEAFATLFLDVDPEVYREHVVGVMLESPYSREELWWILEQEVAPVFLGDLSQVAGDWIPWPAEYLRQRVLARAQRPSRVRRWLSWGRPFHDLYVDGQWHLLCVGMAKASRKLSK